MKQENYFGNSIWVTGTSERKHPFYILRSKFSLEQIQNAQLNVLGLGFFHCYINGKKVGEDEFLPLFSDYEERKNWPIGEKLTGHRIYVPQYDVTELLQEGENCISIHFGGGWYVIDHERFGYPKAIWSLTVQNREGTQRFGSSTQDKIQESYITDNNFIPTSMESVDDNIEVQDLNLYIETIFDANYDDCDWDNAVEAPAVDTSYLTSDCPADRLQETLLVQKLGECDGLDLYDIGKNCSAIPFFRIHASAGETITVKFYESLNADGTPDKDTNQFQLFRIISNGQEMIVRPLFLWYAFRYFTINEGAEPVKVERICTDIAVTSDFRCSNEVINWLYDTFLNTQLSNMHMGIPSDCPHMERRGYTGDGQLVCHAAMNMLDGKSFYRKWIEDIRDCQDIFSGHVQYTAPYTRAGGGPGGWGGAMIEVPYQFCKHYGDIALLKEMYGQMLRYFDYLEAHSENDLVISDKEGEWCLGDWCPPTEVILPAPFVNNYFYIRSLYRMIEIAGLIDREQDVTLFEQRITQRKAAIMRSYYNKWDSNFLGNVQGANAFALDIGLGNERTYSNLVKRYRELGEFDTGIFGTDILIRILFEHGDQDLAVKLLMSEKDHSFGGMRNRGATSLWEHWPESNDSRSLNHPMFGAVTAYLFDYILGIGQTMESFGYENLVIVPKIPDSLQFAEGCRTLPCGKVTICWEKVGDFIEFSVCLPKDVTALFRYGDIEKTLQGKNVFQIEQWHR